MSHSSSRTRVLDMGKFGITTNRRRTDESVLFYGKPLILGRYERSADVPNSFKKSSREDMIKIYSYKA